MASDYTEYQKQEAMKIPVYDVMYRKLGAYNIPYGDKFYVHTNTRRGEISKEPGGFLVDPEHGVIDYTLGSHSSLAKDGRSGVQGVYALQAYYNTFGGGYYDVSHNTKDFIVLLKELIDMYGIQPGYDKNMAPKEKKEFVPKPITKFKNLLEEYQETVQAEKLKDKTVEVPTKAEIGANGYSPDATIIKYMAGRGISADVTKELIGTGLVYLSEALPYYELEKDKLGNPIKDEKGAFKFKLDANGNKIPQTYIDSQSGETRVRMQYNIVFASKDQSKENAFFERKPVAKRGQAYISRGSASAGYFSFTGGLPNFEQVGIPKETHKNMKAYICEAPVDAISLYMLHKAMGKNEPAEYISISGCSKSLAVQRAICEGYDCVLAFDNDEPGKRAMDARNARFIDPATGKECSLPVIYPPKIDFEYAKYKNSDLIKVQSKDWNDILLAATKGKNCSKDPIAVMKAMEDKYTRPVTFSGITEFEGKQAVVPISKMDNTVQTEHQQPSQIQEVNFNQNETIQAFLKNVRDSIEERAIRVSTEKPLTNDNSHTYIKALGTKEIEKILFDDVMIKTGNELLDSSTNGKEVASYFISKLEQVANDIDTHKVTVSTVKEPHVYFPAVGTNELNRILDKAFGTQPELAKEKTAEIGSKDAWTPEKQAEKSNSIVKNEAWAPPKQEEEKSVRAESKNRIVDEDKMI